MRLGLFGGSFDPVHVGHLLLAEYCRQACRLDRVWFVPAAIAPHKQTKDASPPEMRIGMLELAVAGNDAFQISRTEIDRGGVSYTVDTLRDLKAEDESRELFLLMGSDTLLDLPNWKDPGEICTLATPVVVERPGRKKLRFSKLAEIVSPERLAQIKDHVVAMPQLDISSSEIRRRAAAGLSIRYQTPPAVRRFIEENGLYVVGG